MDRQCKFKKEIKKKVYVNILDRHRIISNLTARDNSHLPLCKIDNL